MDIEAVIKPFVGDVNEALKGFEGQVADLNSTVRALEAKAARQALATGQGTMYSGTGERIDDRRDFDSKGWRINETDRKQLADFITKGTQISGVTDAEGAVLIPRLVADGIEALVRLQSPVRSVARVVQMPNRSVGFPVADRGLASGWISETGNRVVTNSPDFSTVTPPGGELYCRPQLTLAAAEDAVTDLEGFLQANVADELASQESAAFISGDGVDKPRGFLSGPAPVATADATRAFGTLQFIPTGAASTLGTDLIGRLLAMVFAMRAGLRQTGGAWMMGTAVLSEIANLKDGQQRPLFLPSMREGVPGTLLGFPVFEAEQMPAVGAGNFPVAFGAWSRGYVIGDRTQLSVLRDPYSRAGFLTLYFRKRVHGAVLNSEAIKLLRVSAT